MRGDFTTRRRCTGSRRSSRSEMMELPIHTHSAIVEMVRVGIQHRNLGEQLEDRKKNEAIQARQFAMQERGLAVQENQTALAMDEMHRRNAGNYLRSSDVRRDARTRCPTSERGEFAPAALSSCAALSRSRLIARAARPIQTMARIRPWPSSSRMRGSTIALSSWRLLESDSRGRGKLGVDVDHKLA